MMKLLGKNAICVGATSGIGHGIAIRLAQAQANVTIIGRNAQMGEQIVADMKAVHPDGKFSFVRCDASLMQDIHGCCEQLKQSHTSLHFLVLSQGIASINGFDPTTEGLDRKLALHYYGRMMFIRRLLPLLNKTAGETSATEPSDVRVLSVLSGGVHSPAIFHDDLDLKKNFSIPNAANVAGFYNDLSLDKLAITNPHITFVHAAPGIVATAWGSGFPFILRGPVRVMQMLIGMSKEKCAENMCQALWNSNAKWNGCADSSNRVRIMSQRGEISNHVTSMHSDAIMEEVWNHTNEVLGKYEKDS